MGRTRRLMLTLVPLLSVTAVPLARARAESIYRPSGIRSMYADRKARAVGDVITVLVTENTISDQKAETTVSREASAAAGADGGLLKFLPLTTLTGREAHTGEGTTSRSIRLLTRISCRVVEITSGGQLVIEGTRGVQINNDLQTVTLRGVVRPEDLGIDNTVPSTLLADAVVKVSGKGPINDRQKPGILSRLFRFLF
ncbi:MAG: flagellar basal body L-ring protein FlgH [Armatimonadetes bacterium]|nr:flagellar basal body L-ring protein FlgH [Armatimonadota bacterium]